ncbi:MAG: hypothetical protein J4452_03900 [Candidatus Aenigmarchaeota archaeon]|nr:hypothetical protein [Candidatus Aenigmarchaeota archaeon]
MTSTEIKIFLIFFIIYAIFIHWNGWDENSRYFLTRAIVDEHRFEIDTFANQTSDRTVVDGHYYSDKDPGISMVASIPYGIFKFFFHDDSRKENQVFITNTIGKVSIYDILNPGYFTLYSMAIVIIFTSVLFSSLTVVLLYKMTNFFTNKKKIKLLFAATAGLATTIFPYALVFTDNAMATFFALFGFYFLLKKKYENVEQKKYSFFAGLCFGIGAITSIFIVIISFVAFIYLFISYNKKNRYLTVFILGFLLIFSVSLTYNFIIFKNPFVLYHFYIDTNLFIFSQQHFYALWKEFIPEPYIFWRLLFDPYKGIFFYYPILLISVYGLYLMRKTMKPEILFIVLVLAFNIVLNSTVSSSWWGGGFFGPRHLTYFVPFFLLPLIFVLDQKSKSKWIKSIFVLTLAFSILVNFAGLRKPAQEIVGDDKLRVANQYESKINSFEILLNPLFDYYFPEFFNSGPRSRILETVSDCDNLVDIREPNPIYPDKCINPISAYGEMVLPPNSSIKFCACALYAGGDGVDVNVGIDGKNHTIHIDSNKCIKEIWQSPFNDGKKHKVTIEPVVYGICDYEGAIIREFTVINNTNQ